MAPAAMTIVSQLIADARTRFGADNVVIRVRVHARVCPASSAPPRRPAPTHMDRKRRRAAPEPIGEVVDEVVDRSAGQGALRLLTSPPG